jgi:diguanylate cyclase (GGDEF)-like protein
VQGQSLHLKLAEPFASLAAAQDAERLRFSTRAAKATSFDWTIEDDRVVWEGSLEIFPYGHDTERLSRGISFLNWLSPDGREKVRAVIEDRSGHQSSFDIAVEASSAMGSEWLAFTGVRIPGPTGKAERIAGILRVITEHQRETQRLTYLATRDELTGHLNRNSLRAALAEAVDRAKSENRGCAYIVASIDRLAMINDGYGFDAGDEVIVAVGERLSRGLRQTDVIGRTAGNKFGVILTNCSEREIAVVAERLRAVVRNSVIDTRSGQVSGTCSVGAVLLPMNAATSQEAMLRAEEALDRARGAGRDGFAIYHRSKQRESARLKMMGIADEIVAALKDNRLVFAYQPIVEARSRVATHYECLLRMLRHDGTIVAAGQFIPAAEQLGLVRLVDRRVLEMAVAQLHAHTDITLAVNVSGTTSADPAWLGSFIEYVRENIAVAPRLIVELTETAALHCFEDNAQFVSQLRDMGCRVAIDDFGAGYTSFRNLQMMRLDMVKIDGAYVHGLSGSPENQVFVRTLVDLAKNFKLKTVAEWVGSDEDAKLLEEFGIDYFQGFHFGEPSLTPVWLE